MKKTLILISIFTLIFNTLSAQKLDWQERRKVADQIDELIENYINNCELTELGGSEYSADRVEAFKALFTKGAKVTDEANLQAAEDGGGATKEQSIGEYTTDLMARYAKGMTIKITKLQVDYSELDERKATVFMERQFRAKKEDDAYFIETSDLILQLEIDKELDFVKITNLTTDPPPPPRPTPKTNEAPIAKNDKATVKSGKTVAINIASNDSDPNGDNLTYTKVNSATHGKIEVNRNGKWTYTAKPTKEDLIEKIKYEVCDSKGACSQAIITIAIEPEPVVNNGRGLYIDLIAGLGASGFDAGSVAFDYGINRGVTENAITGSGSSSIGFGAEIDYFFTNNIGIGAGIQYNRVGGKFDVNNFKANYQSDVYNYGNDSDWDYERIVSIDNLTEDYTVTNLGIPLLLKLKTTISDKIGVFANAGILYNLSSAASSDFGGGTIDYEAIYYSVDGMDYGYDNTDAIAVNTDELVRSNVNQFQDAQLNLNTGVQAVSMDDKIEFDSHIGLLGRIGLTYALSDKMSVLIGGQYTSGSLSSGSTEGYRIADLINSAGQGEYNSPLNGGASYSTFGLNVGLSIKL